MEKNSKDLVSEMKGYWTEFETELAVYTEKQKFPAASRARKALGELRRLVTPFRKALIDEVKAERLVLKKAKKSKKTKKVAKTPKTAKVVEAPEAAK